MSIFINKLTKNIGKNRILSEIDFHADAGEIVGILGPNGAGKTTLMKIITGAYSYTQGNVKVCGLEVKEHRQAIAQKIGYLPEHNALYEDMYIREYLLYVAGLRKTIHPDKRVQQLMEEVGLMPEKQKKIGTLSKGYRQRVGFAQALMGNPEVLILDEPTTGLDPNQLDEIRALIRRIGQHRTVLLSTHILQEVKEMCTRAIVINHGRITADLPDLGNASLSEEDVYTDIELARPLDKKDWLNLSCITAVVYINANRVRLTSKNDIRTELFRMAQQTNNPILHLQLHSRTLEEVFRQSTHQ